MIIELNGQSPAIARRCASAFLERTNSARSLTSPSPRPANISPRALKIERARTRAKVAATKKMRAEILELLDQWRARCVDAIKKVKAREADASGVAAALDDAVAAGVLTDAQRQQMIADLTAAIQSMDPKQLAAVVLQIQSELFAAGLDSGKAEVGITWDVPPTGALEALSSQVITFSADVVEREIVALRQALTDGIAAGDGIPELIDRVQSTFDDGMHILDDDGKIVRVIPNDSWAEQVARTETSRAMNAGVFRAYHAAGVEKIQWIAAEDERTCPECSDLDGQTVMLGATFGDSGVDNAPAHVSCCPPGTIVETSRGRVAIETVSVDDLVLTHRGRFRRVSGTMQREVAEDLWTVRAGNRVLRVTDNHPVLTRNGWKSAASLQVSDQVYCMKAEPVFGVSGQADDSPAEFHQTGRFDSVSVALPTGKVPASAVNLNGKHTIWERDVDEVLLDGIVCNGSVAARQESIENDGFVSREDAALARAGNSGSLSEGSAPSASGVVRGFGQSRAFDSIGGGHAHEHCLTPVALLESEANEARVNRGAGDSVILSKLFEGFAGQVFVVDASAPRVVEAARWHTVIVPIESIERTQYAGPVFNFEVEEDESYVASGVVVHNCRCTTVSVGFVDEAKAA